MSIKENPFKPRYCTINDAMVLLSCVRGTILNRFEKGVFTKIKRGGKVYLELAEIERYFNDEEPIIKKTSKVLVSVQKEPKKIVRKRRKVPKLKDTDKCKVKSQNRKSRDKINESFKKHKKHESSNQKQQKNYQNDKNDFEVNFELEQMRELDYRNHSSGKSSKGCKKRKGLGTNKITIKYCNGNNKQKNAKSYSGTGPKGKKISERKNINNGKNIKGRKNV